jgi:hypothetical protein
MHHHPHQLAICQRAENQSILLIISPKLHCLQEYYMGLQECSLTAWDERLMILTKDKAVTCLALEQPEGANQHHLQLHLGCFCSYQLKPCLLEGVYFSSRAVNFRSEYFCSRFIWATDWQLICSDMEFRLGRWELWKLCHLSLCLEENGAKWVSTKAS